MQLVLLGYDVTTFTPVTYQRRESSTALKSKLILRKVSRLDAFSALSFLYITTSALPGGTTDTPAVHTTRSSRTKVMSSQFTNAHHR